MTLVESADNDDTMYDVDGIKVVVGKRVLGTLMGDLTVDYVKNWSGEGFSIFDELGGGNC